jgi:DNA primase
VLEGIFKVNTLAHEYYQQALFGAEGQGAREYLAGRELGEEEARRFGVGFAPDRWEGVAQVLRQAGIPGEVGERAGLLRARSSGGHYDLLRGRIVFPIQDARGRVIGFGGRAMAPDQEPKYLNSPESPVFRKREAFYGFPGALEPMRSHDRAVVVEGYFDQIALARAGMGEAIATCGTALSLEHAKGLTRRTRNVVLLFDGDEAGQRAMLRALEALLPAGLRVRAAALPGGVDPDDLLRSDGAEALARLVDEAPPALEIAIARAAAAGCKTPWERADAVAAVVPLLALVADPVERGEFGRRLALAVGA